MKRFNVSVKAKLIKAEQQVSVIASDYEEAEGLALGMIDNPVTLEVLPHKTCITEESDDFFILVAVAQAGDSAVDRIIMMQREPLLVPGFTLREVTDEFLGWMKHYDLKKENLKEATVFKDNQLYCKVTHDGRCWDLNDPAKEIKA